MGEERGEEGGISAERIKQSEQYGECHHNAELKGGVSVSCVESASHRHPAAVEMRPSANIGPSFPCRLGS